MYRDKIASTAYRKKQIGLMLRNKIAGFVGPLNTMNIDSYGVAGFAMEQLITGYTGIAFRLVDSSDSSEQDFYFSGDGSFDFAAVDAWVAGTPLVKRWGNQFKAANYAYQNTEANMPTLDTTNECLVFDGSNTYLIIDDYSEIQLTLYPLAIYGTYNKDLDHGGCLLGRNGSGISEVQYALLTTSGGYGNISLNGSARAFLLDGSGGSWNNGLGAWISNAANETIYKLSASEHTATYGTTLNARTNIRIGSLYNTAGAGSHSSYYDGKIRTLLLFNTGQEIYDKYDDLVTAGL